MARIKLDKPEKFIFQTEIPVRITDLNYGNHLANDAILSIVHEARVRFLNHFSYSEDNIEGAGIIMGDAAIIYKSEGFYGDVLIIDMAVTDFSRKSCDFFYLVKNKSDGREVALVKTGIVFFDYQLRKPVSIPDKFKLICQNKKGD
ncbi:MAG: acyl-CoA thioesterase [Calditrichaceae bacterium]